MSAGRSTMDIFGISLHPVCTLTNESVRFLRAYNALPIATAANTKKMLEMFATAQNRSGAPRKVEFSIRNYMEIDMRWNIVEGSCGQYKGRVKNPMWEVNQQSPRCQRRQSSANAP